MQEIYWTVLEKRAILYVSGKDSRSFLQALISNDIMKVTKGLSIFAALLSPQGKYQYDFFISETDGGFFLDCERDRLEMLHKRLQIFKLRSKVSFSEKTSELRIIAVWGKAALDHFNLQKIPGQTKQTALGLVLVDPRLVNAGLRIITDSEACNFDGVSISNLKAYDQHRINLGLTDGSRDLLVDKSILLEANFDETNGIDWDKGCYLGQEVTARSRYRGLIKKRFLPIKIAEGRLEEGEPITANGKRVGEVRSVVDNIGMAILNIDFLNSNNQLCLSKGYTVTPIIPDWVRLQVS